MIDNQLEICDGMMRYLTFKACYSVLIYLRFSAFHSCVIILKVCPRNIQASLSITQYVHSFLITVVMPVLVNWESTVWSIKAGRGVFLKQNVFKAQLTYLHLREFPTICLVMRHCGWPHKQTTITSRRTIWHSKGT